MQAHLTEDISLAEVVKIAKLSQSQFARAFRDSTGMPPYQYILQARIQRAQQMLEIANFSISEVTTSVGLADQSHFTKAFLRFVGATPKRWRQDRQG
jgi:AraC family transcriptional regulator